MEKTKLKKISEWCNGRVTNKEILNKDCFGVSIDSRTTKEGDLFVAIKGLKQDGHKFINEALSKGAIAALVETIDPIYQKKAILVNDTITALGSISKEYKKLFNPYTIGITGSDGKTTTKELVKNILSTTYQTSGTIGNLNNYIGMPLSILSIKKRDDICVLEMGMNKKGEIDYLSKIAQLQAGIISNIGTAHIGYFNSMSAIAETKAEILQNLIGEKLSILNYDNKFYNFFKQQTKGPLISFGMKKGSDVKGFIREEKDTSFSFGIEGEKEVFNIEFWNTAIIYSMLISFAVSKKFEVDIKKFKTIIEKIKPLQGRGMIHKKDKLTIIDETYNCNPNSLKWALLSFSRKSFKKKVAIIGNMEELGKLSYILHRNIGLLAKSINLNTIITYGEKTRVISQLLGNNCVHFEDINSLNKHLLKTIKGDKLF